jgi:pimeloyl-ACP methyl ester carboxylesterase
MSSPMPPSTPLHDFGGDGPVIHLAHANGFPPGTYRLLAGTLTSDYHVIALPSRALWPGSRPDSAPTWHPLAEDLIQGLNEMQLSGIVGVGHSIGAVLTLWAAIRQADLFRAVVLVEPVILPPAWLLMLRLLRRLGLARRQPLVQAALHRRRIWPSRGACYEHFKTKALFARWPAAALRDYVNSGTRLLSGGQVELAYPPQWEAHIFATTPTDIWRDVPRLRIPALVIRGERSQTFRSATQARLARQLPRATFVTISGAGHLVPMERPKETGAAICSFLKDLAA